MGNGERNSTVAPFMTRILSIVLLLFSVVSARADLRYNVDCEIKKGPLQELNGLAPGGDLLADCQQKFFSKGKRELTRGSNQSVLLDFDNDTQTVINHRSKTWTRQSLKELAAEMEEARADLPAPKFSITKQGEKRTIDGLAATGLFANMELELPVSNVPGGPKLFLSMDIEIWSSREVAGADGATTLRQLESVLGGLPGAEDLKALNPTGQGLPLEIRLLTRFKGMEKPQLGDGLADPLGVAGALENGGVLMEMVMHFSGHETKPIPDAEFAIPKDYKEKP
jgi:hypothetical protein